MVTSMTRWPPVGGHPAMKVTIEVLFRRAGEGGTKVTIEVLFRRAGEGGTREVGVRGARLLFRLVLVFLALLLALLSVAFLV
jgi:hypothetical protein